MAHTRKIHKVIKSKPVLEGAGVHLKRVFGFGQTHLFDPFLLMDDFRSDNPDHFMKGFPWHPHRGIETITYVLDGDVEHGDSLGNKGIISSGDVQWMTAGSGIIHQEMPKGSSTGNMEGFQLWANLPASQKMMDPRYRDVKASEIPNVTFENGIEMKIISGKIGDVKGPVQDIVIDPEYLDITIPAKTEFTHPTKMGYTVLVYVIGGNAYFCKEKKPYNYEVEGINYFDMGRSAEISDETLVLFEDGDHIAVTTEDESVRFLLMAGKPLKEPIAWQGPIVMNTREELQLAFKEYQEGTFVKHKKR